MTGTERIEETFKYIFKIIGLLILAVPLTFLSFFIPLSPIPSPIEPNIKIGFPDRSEYPDQECEFDINKPIVGFPFAFSYKKIEYPEDDINRCPRDNSGTSNRHLLLNYLFYVITAFIVYKLIRNTLRKNRKESET